MEWYETLLLVLARSGLDGIVQVSAQQIGKGQFANPSIQADVGNACMRRRNTPLSQQALQCWTDGSGATLCTCTQPHKTCTALLTLQGTYGGSKMQASQVNKQNPALAGERSPQNDLFAYLQSQLQDGGKQRCTDISISTSL